MSRPPELLFVQETPVAGDVTCMEVFTDQGVIVCLRHGLNAGESQAVLCLPGALGGLSGPAGGVFHHAAATLGGVRIHYRKPNDITHCVFDALLVHHLLERRGIERVVLLGHSFGGAIALAAGVRIGAPTAGVVTLASQVPGAEEVAELEGRPVLFIHGDRDTILVPQCSEFLYAQAAEPKELVIVPGEDHMFQGVKEVLGERIVRFATDAFAGHRASHE